MQLPPVPQPRRPAPALRSAGPGLPGSPRRARMRRPRPPARSHGAAAAAPAAPGPRGRPPSAHRPSAGAGAVPRPRRCRSRCGNGPRSRPGPGCGSDCSRRALEPPGPAVPLAAAERRSPRAAGAAAPGRPFAPFHSDLGSSSPDCREGRRPRTFLLTESGGLARLHSSCARVTE